MPTNSGMLPPSTVIGFIGAGNMAEAILRGIRRYFAKNPPLAKSKLARLD